MKIRVVVAAATTLVALLSGCSSGSDHHPDAAPASTSTAATTKPAAPTSIPFTTPNSPGTEADPTIYRQSTGGAGVAGYFFTSPSGNFHCAILDKPIPFAGENAIEAGCQGQAAVPQGKQECAKNGQAMPGFALGVAGPLYGCLGDGGAFYGGTDDPALPYGSYLKIRNYKCSSREVGVTCTLETSGVSFFVSKEHTVLTQGK
ncbi:hypothetical protein AB0N05_01090 [Nocardia sp. NPDC051030]|uniref:hypothetical protein n=1 Tax=Nocardia sp. NPDC051030 TaxID=3155162 RepID=UPI00343ADC1A